MSILAPASLGAAIDQASRAVALARPRKTVFDSFGNRTAEALDRPVSFIPRSVARRERLPATRQRLSWAAREIAATGGYLSEEVASLLSHKAAKRGVAKADLHCLFQALASLDSVMARR